MTIPHFKLERYFARYEFTTQFILCASDCETITVGQLLEYSEGSREEFLNLTLGYTESAGNPHLRNRVTDLYGSISADEVLIHTGAEEAIFNFMNVAFKPGDELIVHAPHYQSLGEIARSAGVRVVEWRGDPEKGWALDLDFLKEAVTGKTRVVAVNFPHNPTGFLPDMEFVNGLSRLSDIYGFIVFSDEVYRGLEYNPADRLTAFADLNDRAVSLGVMSKTYGLAGLRIGWIATRNREIYEKMAEFKDYTTICSSAPAEFLAALALEHGDALAARNRAVIAENLHTLEAFFNRHDDLFTWYRPKAGPIAFPRYSGGSVDDFCDDLVRNAGVLLLPGTLFGDEYDCFRIGFGRTNMIEALHAVERYLTS